MVRDIQTNTVEEQVYKILLNDIRTLRLPPGSRVNEYKIAEDLQVSRSPVRDAIKRLRGDKLIVIVPNKGAFVRKLSTQELHEMYEVRLMMEHYALDNVAYPLNEEGRTMLLSLLERGEAAYEANDLAAYLSVDFSIHRGIVSLCRNECLNNVYETLHWQLYTVFSDTKWDLLHFQRVRNDHWDIVQNLIDRKPDVAKKLLTAHIARAREIISARNESD